MIRRIVAVCAGILFAGAAAAQTPLDDEIIVTPGQLPPAAGSVAYSSTHLSAAELQASPALTLDDALRRVPGFGLFRRSSSRVAHPTTQGVSLRNLGPNGAGRTLLLLDGVPQNDPFGGWIYWTSLPMAIVGSAEITRGGGAGYAGNSALAGVISLQSKVRAGNFLEIDASVGSRETQNLSLSGQVTVRDTEFFVNLNEQTSEGYFTLHKDQRGPIDQRADVDAVWVEGGIRHHASENLTLTFKSSYLSEDRSNGTPLNGNKTEAVDVSLSAYKSAGPKGTEWEAHLYFKDRDFENQFTAVDAERTADRIVLDQFDVPAQSFGGVLRVRFPLGDVFETELGADFRSVKGETNELFRFIDGVGTRIREAGGKQFLSGIYVEGTWLPTGETVITGSARLDYWRSFAGRSIENEISDGSFLRNDEFDARSNVIANFRFGAAHDVTNTVQVRAALYSGYRAPTINELYRPFRVRVDVTGANEDLVPEKLLGGEIGLRWQLNDVFGTELTLFQARLKNAIANVTIGAGPGNFPPFGFVPGGGVLRQRQNLEKTESRGIEWEASLKPSDALSLDFSYLYAKSTVKESLTQPELNGNRLAQTPKHQFTLALNYAPGENWNFSAFLQGTSKQFENDTNTLSLDSYLLTGVSAQYRINGIAALYAVVENLFDETVEVGRTGTGLISIGAPRLFTLGLRLRFGRSPSLLAWG